MKTLFAIIELIPLIMGLIRGVRNQIKEGRKRDEIKKNTEAINEAFEANDPDLAARIINDMWMRKQSSKGKTADKVVDGGHPGDEESMS